MVFFNYALRKLNAKIVYYGPGLCGKTTNLQWIHDHFEGGQRGKMISLATEGDRTIFFDLLPIDIGSIRGMDVTLQLYTVPGQVHYNSTRQLVLRGADGVVFVADSQRTMRASNAESFENLQENLMLQGIDLKEFPHILQFNKRDLRDLLSVEDLNECLNVFSTPIFEAIATEGIGVQESLEGIVKLVMRNLREKYEPVASAVGPQPLSPMQSSGPAAFTPSSVPPVVEVPDPLAPDFVSQVEPPPAVDQPDSATPSFEAPAFEPAPDEARDVGQESGFAAFQDEDGILTAVYEADDEEIVAYESALEDHLPEAETAGFDAVEEPSAFEPENDKPNHHEGLFTDTRDEDGTAQVEVASPATFDVGDSDVGDEPVTDPAIVADTPEPEDVGETIDDLFESEVPTVKAFMEDMPDVVAIEGEAGDDSPPPTVDPPARVAGPSTTDHYEDRIEAPGPFAPPPTSPADAGESEEDRAEREAEAVHAEVRHALGASEDREALASLPIDEKAEIEAVIESMEKPIEVQRVVPPPPEDPVAAGTVEAEEATPPSFFVDVGVDAGAAAEVEDSRQDDEPPVVEPEPAEPNFEVTERTDSTFVDDRFEEPVADEPIPEETPDAVPVGEPPMPPPAAPDASPPESRPIMFGVGDPFFDGDAEAVVPEVMPPAAAMQPMTHGIDVSAESNQLHLQLRGSGAIAEMGQVRALDIEVPVPGQWVGNQKVTLQLRLTLTPAEDENG